MADVKGLTWTMPIEDAVALGRALYAADDDHLASEGVTETDLEAITRVFDSLDAFLSAQLGDDWLGDIEE